MTDKTDIQIIDESLATALNGCFEDFQYQQINDGISAVQRIKDGVPNDIGRTVSQGGGWTYDDVNNVNHEAARHLLKITVGR